MNTNRICTAAVLALWLLPSAALAQALQHPDGFLDYVYPAGAQAGQTVRIELGGLAGMTGAKQVLVEGPPGVSVREVTAKAHNLVEAQIEIAADAPPGRRLLRVAGGPGGLTNFRPFFVGSLPEPIETEPNNSPEKAQTITIPAVVNARLEKTLDEDCFRFEGKQGQSIVAAITAHGMDCIVRQSFIRGFVDTSLELLNEGGQVLASAEDTVGLDPLVHFTLPADGTYVVRVRSVAYQGAPSAVYRLTLGEVPYVTSIFPSGGQRGQTVEVELHGPNIAAGTRRKLEIVADDRFLLQDFVWAEASQRLPLVRGDVAELIEQEPNQNAKEANELKLDATANAQFEQQGDEDWYALTLAKGQGVVLHTLAQRHLRSPVDTAIAIVDETGKTLAANDDGSLFMGQAWHDFEAADSRLTFTAPADGRYFVRVTNASGFYGEAAIYRLTIETLSPDFHLFQWPDAVPIWGPGSTASFLVQVFTGGGLESDIELHVEGLPADWQASVSHLPDSYLRPYANSATGAQALITITAPRSAEVGTIAPLRVFGRAIANGKMLQREAQYLTLYGNSHNDRMFLRYSRDARAVIAPPLDCQLETDVKELTITHGGAADIPVRLTRLGEAKPEIGLSVDGSTVAAGCGWQAPQGVAADKTEIVLPFRPSTEWKPGSYTIVVSRSWAADLRSGRPGPCTPAIRLNILPAEGAK